jgi:hypothetical protein
MVEQRVKMLTQEFTLVALKGSLSNPETPFASVVGSDLDAAILLL